MEPREHEEIKRTVRERYDQIARQSLQENKSSCCGSECGCSDGDVLMAEDYSAIEGYVPEADLGLGCGIPTRGAAIHEGDTVLDLGSGAGNDAFIARRIVGPTGTVIGVDMTEVMIQKANANKALMGYTNVEFRLGDIEQLPVESDSVDVVISNCVLNLVPDKRRAFGEMHRVLKPGGRFTVSDIVVTNPLPTAVRSAAELYIGCIAGAMVKEDYVTVAASAGFRNLDVLKEKQVDISDDVLLNSLKPAEIDEFRRSGSLIMSITLHGEK
jgi:arsenite methyltransferase